MSQSLPGTVSVVIVGGGVMGVSLLYHLALEGWTDVVLIEKGELTSGSTWHAAGQCPSFIADYNMAKIHDHGIKLYPKLEELTGQYVSWHGCGGIRFAYTPEEVAWFHRVASIGKLIGYDCEIIDRAKIRQIFPHIDTEGVLAGAWTASDGHVDPAGITQAMAKGARDLGSRIITRNRVVDIHQKPSGDWQIITEKGDIDCQIVVNAAGCYARQIAQMAGTDIPITNMKHTYIVTDSVPEFMHADVEMPVIRDPYASAYYRQEQKSALIGIYETQHSEECWTHRGGWPEWESENELFNPDFDNLTPYIERVMQRLPMWENLGIKRVVCGAIPHTPDANPYLGPAAGLRNFWHCNGASIGIAAGAGSGKYLAQWMIYGDAEINMAGLDPRRFGKFAPGPYTKAKSHQDYEHMYVLHLPGEERPASRKTKVTPLYDRLLANGAVYTEINGWERPKWFSLDGREEQPGFKRNNVFEVVAAECNAVRERVGIMDLSSFAKFDVTGKDAEAMLNRVSANKISSRAGGITLTHYLSEQGRITGESTITRLDDEHFYVLSGMTAQDRDFDTLTHGVLPGEEVRITDVSDEYGVLVLAGPDARRVLEQLTDTDLSNKHFRWLTGKNINIAGIAVRALRVNYVGELGWELHCPMDDMLNLYDALWEAGRAFDIVNFGSYAVNSMRMEKAYKGWGSELTNEINMVEADLIRFLGQDKADFTGKQATLAALEKLVESKIVYLELVATDSDIAHGEPVFSKGKPIGITTSGGYGHVTQKSLGFAFVDAKFSKPGTRLMLDLQGESCSAVVLDEPVWDPEAKRSRA